MAIGREERRRERAPRVTEAFGTERAATVLDLLEIVEFAWHDCYGEVSPPEAVVDDILTCAQGDVMKLIRAAHLAIIDSRDLALWAADVRGATS